MRRHRRSRRGRAGRPFLAAGYARPPWAMRDAYGRAGPRSSSRATRPSAPGDEFPRSPESQRSRNAAVFSDPPEVDGDQEADGERETDDVEHIEPEESVRSELLAAEEDEGELV